MNQKDILPVVSRIEGQNWKWVPSIVYGLCVIWTGLWRCIDAVAYKPNALWFCMVAGLIGVAAGFLYRVGRPWWAAGVGLVSAGSVLAFYLNCLIGQPEKDATFRVGFVILVAIAQLIVVALPKENCCRN